MNTVTLEQAKRLAALGYEVEFPQMVWVRWRDYDDWEVSIQRHFTGLLSTEAEEWYPAPDLLTALEWLEKEKGWFIAMDYPNYLPEQRWTTANEKLGFVGTAILQAPTATDLLTAILDKLEVSK